MSRQIDQMGALEALAALSQETRLTAFRALVKAHPDEIAAGEIARVCDVPHNTMSTHLAALSRAGLATVRREGRSMFYSADIGGFQSLIGFLMRDCCGGRAEICAPLIAQISCAPKAKAKTR